ncbi:NAD-dependent epimerase/dehydratase family protein [Flavobacterium sp. ANB]|uniref:NAD-dependent epimerase/dehydratase family protein n=1 Tax=unclassified Flavobacterium TaxID=196869 RepID=UPI0012B9E4E4|nr:MULTISPECIES: NAD-dependent epimerase/dehydratase family protein [unclassified Flavobacterium]MBF4517616.1 NAD-dependent epimerase/dehydratase family protein [Flavobacterium sp. ANB]MTD70343.1 NAD-dependent epimerase/dehydratase family protein [Flavobacterium sp. LC2016-13]
MSTSIVIGSNGYIGHNLTDYLRSLNEEVYCFDIQDKSINDSDNYNQLDITDYNSVCELNLNVDYIYLFAGLTGTSQGFDSYGKYIDINEKGLLNILTRMNESGSQARIVFPSTRLVYKGKQNTLLKEDAEKETNTIYALNKLTCEYILAMYQKAFGIQYTIFRICVPYGSLVKSEISYGTLGFFLQKAKNQQNIELYGDGSLRRTFTHVVDICNIIHSAIQYEESNGKTYNIGGENLSLLDVASEIAKKHSVKVVFTEWPKLTLQIESGDTIFDSEDLDKLVNKGTYYNFREWLLKE